MYKKEILTIEKIKERNTFDGLFMCVMTLILWGFLGIVLYAIHSEFEALTQGPGFIVPILVAAIPIGCSVSCIKDIKNKIVGNMKISSSKFKIVEDEIYDKFKINMEADSHKTDYRYRVFLKTYGKIDVDGEIYDRAKQGEMMYLLFYNGNEKKNSYESAKKEEKRNEKNIEQKYLSKYYELPPELLNNFISYDKIIGESNFNKRIQDELETLKKSRPKVNCRKCGEKYSLKKFDTCPNCNSLYKFDITDIIHKKEWY
jgi:hypothetical protein